MSSNPNLNKQAQKFIFSKKLRKVCHLTLGFNNTNQVNHKIVTGIRKYLTWPALLTMHKYFIKPYLGYDDITCDQDYNLTFHRLLARQLEVG